MGDHLSMRSAGRCEVTINAENICPSIYHRTVHLTLRNLVPPPPSHLISKLEVVLPWKSEGIATPQGPLPQKKYCFKLLAAEALH